MSEEELVELTKQYANEVWNQGNLEAIDDYLAEDFEMGYPMPGMGSGREDYKEFAAMMRSAFPDLENKVEDTFASGNRVVQLWTAEGTHEGELFGAPATDREVTFAGISIYKVEDGKIQHDWTIADLQGLMQQLGLTPEPTR